MTLFLPVVVSGSGAFFREDHNVLNVLALSSVKIAERRVAAVMSAMGGRGRP